MSTTASVLRDWALALAERGMFVFPVAVGRKDPPAVKNWNARATTDPERITQCWNHRPYNIGIACGPSQLVVVDLDTPRDDDVVPECWSTLSPASGVDVFADLARRVGATVPATFTVATPSGGRHLYFRSPHGAGLRNTGKKLGWKIDTRAEGGYVVGPGSLVTEGGYALLDDSAPERLPGWLHQRLAPTPSTATTEPNQIAATDPGRYLAVVLDGQADRVAAAQPSRHNHTLFVAACRLGEFVAGGALDANHARTVLTAATARWQGKGSCRCTDGGIDNTITSGLNAGASKPRRPAA